MISKALLVSSCRFKENSPIVGNFSYEYIVPFLKIAQDLLLSQIIGERLLVRLYEAIVPDPDTLNPNEKTLLDDYITPFLIHSAMAKAYTNLLFKPDNSGLVKRDSENGTAADMNEASFLQDQEKTIGESYGLRLKEYLEANRLSYPEYNTEIPGEIKPANTPSFTGGLWLGKKCNI